MILILASQSAARRAMLTAVGVVHEAIPAHVDEDAITAALLAEQAGPQRIADALAETKALKISRLYPEALVIGADTVVITAGGVILAKPETRARAEQQLQTLAGHSHQLISAAVICEAGRPVWRAAAAAKLTMRPLSPGYISAYLDAEGDAVLGCVGCYRIESIGAQLFTNIEGDHFAIKGLPLLPVLTYLRTRGVMTS